MTRWTRNARKRASRWRSLLALGRQPGVRAQRRPGDSSRRRCLTSGCHERNRSSRAPPASAWSARRSTRALAGRSLIAFVAKRWPAPSGVWRSVIAEAITTLSSADDQKRSPAGRAFRANGSAGPCVHEHVRTSKQVPTAAHASDHAIAEGRRAGSREPGRSLRDAGAEDWPADFGSPGEIVSGVVAADEVVLTNRSVDG
jgi:hypothetical protein